MFVISNIISAIKNNSTVARLVVAGNAVEESALAGAAWPQDTYKSVRLDRKPNILY